MRTRPRRWSRNRKLPVRDRVRAATGIALGVVGAEEVPVMISRLLEAHETIITAVREAIERTERNGDWGSNDVLMSDVLRRHELQVWFLSEHLVEVPLVDA